MSMYYKQHGKPEVRKHTKHGRTKQAYKDSCDINKILERYQTEEGLSHIQKHGASYGDFAAIDWENLPLKLAEGRQIFDELPAEIKREFDQSPGAFFEYVADPDNSGRLTELLPAIAKRGNFPAFVNKPDTRPLESAQEEQTPPNAGGGQGSTENASEGETS